MRECRPTRGRVGVWRSGAFLGIAIFFLGTSLSQAQDVAEAARQEQARKAAEKSSPKHVYTEEDLKKGKILTPDDQAKIAARKHQGQEQAPAQTATGKQEPAEQESQTESLGEIARRYRREKAERQAEEASKKNYTPFQYELARPTAAAPKAGVTPAPVIRPHQPNMSLPSLVAPPAEPRRLPQFGGGKGRVSPFQPRPFLAAPPVVHFNSKTALPTISEVPRPAPAVPRGIEAMAKPGLRPILVQTGDSWWKLASRYLRSGARWSELRGLNPKAGGSPDLLRAGITVLVPEEKHARADASSKGGQNRIRVKPGDTLWSLAHEHLGRGSAWACLASLNPEIQNYQRMPVGTLLQLPAPNQAGVCANADEGLKN